MADWKQITARIRRARTSKDPAGQLSNLFQKTRDAMVAFELGRYFEAITQPDEAVKWYAVSAQRFRRGDWKTKAEESVTRLGGTLPAEGEILPLPELPASSRSATLAEAGSELVLPFDETMPAPGVEAPAAVPALPASSAAPDSADSEAEHKGKRRRGRRGGRNRRKSPPPGTSENIKTHGTAAAARAAARIAAPPPEETEILPPRVVDTRSIPRLPVETTGEASVPSPKGRFGDPGLSSRLSLLEMQFRRLLTCAPAKLDQADRAPAGPGVFVLTDDDMTSYYYVEACQTLRIAIANIARGSGNRRAGPAIKSQLAEHLEIPEARVTKYMADHCVVRWLQLDEGAEHFAHFAIAVLRPILNTDS
jgi:hypothetical protein